MLADRELRKRKRALDKPDVMVENDETVAEVFDPFAPDAVDEPVAKGDLEPPRTRRSRSASSSSRCPAT